MALRKGKLNYNPIERSTLATELERSSINLSNLINAVMILDPEYKFATALHQSKASYNRMEKLLKKCREEGLLPL